MEISEKQLNKNLEQINLNEENLNSNLNLMKSAEKGGMMYLLIHESFGGNAGFDEEGNPGIAANFTYDAETGKIIEFTNYNKK
jgi:hypothetical protein